MPNQDRRYKKTVEILLYLSSIDQRLYWVLKSIWLAERIHLSRYGRMITGDTYVAMSHGPVPSLAYDIVKSGRGSQSFTFEDPKPNAVMDAPDNYTVIPRKQSDADWISKSEKDCLDEALAFLAPMSFQEVKAFSHTAAFKAASENDDIPFEEFVKELENGTELLKHLASA